ncbi:MAG: hypothetical protein CM1200mP23_1240 [Nitrososphaerota archaeon]|nr:MAG: hypothetical protein CM1200mP23_1240 [Nitrososphaerota archaeon]
MKLNQTDWDRYYDLWIDSNPLVSSSKNLNNPALDAGNGAFFFLSAISDSEI